MPSIRLDHCTDQSQLHLNPMKSKELQDYCLTEPVARAVMLSILLASLVQLQEDFEQPPMAQPRRQEKLGSERKMGAVLIIAFWCLEV